MDAVESDLSWAGGSDTPNVQAGTTEGGNTPPGTGGTSPTGGSGPGAGGTGIGSGGTGTGGTGSGGAPPFRGDFHVTSPAGDAGPGTLRNAIDQVITLASPVTITFDPGLTIRLNQKLPPLSSDVQIIGNDTHLIFSLALGMGSCIVANTGSTVVLDGLEISGCNDDPVDFNAGANHQLRNSTIRDFAGSVHCGSVASGVVVGPSNRIENSSSDCISLACPSPVVADNEIYDCADKGVRVEGNGASVVGNTIVRASHGIYFDTGAANPLIAFNTLVSTGQGVRIISANNVTIRNNIIAHPTGFPISDIGDAISTISNNVYFDYTTGAPCNGCSSGAGSLIRIDPLFVDFAGDDFDLQDGSPAIDAGVDVGEDRNGGASGNFFGLNPDMGSFETNY